MSKGTNHELMDALEHGDIAEDSARGRRLRRYWADEVAPALARGQAPFLPTDDPILQNLQRAIRLRERELWQERRAKKKDWRQAIRRDIPDEREPFDPDRVYEAVEPSLAAMKLLEVGETDRDRRRNEFEARREATLAQARRRESQQAAKMKRLRESDKEDQARRRKGFQQLAAGRRAGRTK